MSPDDDHTHLLNQTAAGDPGASAMMAALLYPELRALAAIHLARESPGHTLQATALANEAYIKLIDQTRADFNDQRHIMAVAAGMALRLQAKLV